MNSKPTTIEQDGSVYVLKKPFWKKFSFWYGVVSSLIAVFFLLGCFALVEENKELQARLESSSESEEHKILLKLMENIKNARELGLSDTVVTALIDSAMSELDLPDGENNDAYIDTGESEEETNTYKIGNSVSFNDDSIVTVNSIRVAPEVDMRSYVDGDTKVVVEVTIENKGNTPLDVNAQRFDVYDSNLELGDFDSTTYGNNIPHKIAAGMKANLTIHFVTKASGPFAISYADVIWKE